MLGYLMTPLGSVQSKYRFLGRGYMSDGGARSREGAPGTARLVVRTLAAPCAMSKCP